jgi:hypothetical protein
MRVLPGMLPMLNLDNPNDNAFKLVSINFVLCRLLKKKPFQWHNNPNLTTMIMMQLQQPMHCP